MTHRYCVETIGDATEDVIRTHVQDQLKVMDAREKNSQQLELLHNSVACSRVVYHIVFINLFVIVHS